MRRQRSQISVTPSRVSSIEIKSSKTMMIL
jgi:hypothetical protein